MRIPRRDTQIFSLSMMDVISGAMGAFLIIMIVLMRYYKDDEDIAAQRDQLQQQLAEIREQMAQVMQQLAMTTDIDVADLLRRFEQMRQQMAMAQQQVNRLSNDLQAARSRANQLQSQNAELASENQSLSGQLHYRRPFLVIARWQAPQAVDVDLVVVSSGTRVDGRQMRFDPIKKQTIFFGGDLSTDGTGSENMETWLTRDSTNGEVYNIFVVLREAPDMAIVPTRVTVFAQGEGLFHGFEPVMLTPDQRWMVVGQMMTGPDGKTVVQPLSDAERRRLHITVEQQTRAAASEGN